MPKTAPLNISIQVIDIENDQVIRDTKTNLFDNNSVEWLLKLIKWAVHSGHEVNICNEKDLKKYAD